MSIAGIDETDARMGAYRTGKKSFLSGLYACPYGSEPRMKFWVRGWMEMWRHTVNAIESSSVPDKKTPLHTLYMFKEAAKHSVLERWDGTDVDCWLDTMALFDQPTD